MTIWLKRFAQAEDGAALFDGLIIAAGVTLMALSVILVVAPDGDAITDTPMERVERPQEARPT